MSCNFIIIIIENNNNKVDKISKLYFDFLDILQLELTSYRCYLGGNNELQDT